MVIFFVPDMPHLTTNIVTCLEKSSLKSSKRNLKYGKAPVNLGMIEEIWLKMGSPLGQLQATKLTKAWDNGSSISMHTPGTDEKERKSYNLTLDQGKSPELLWRQSVRYSTILFMV